MVKMKNTLHFSGEKIKERRLQMKMSQSKLSKLADISPGYVSLIETGLRKPTVDILSRLADSLDVRVGYFFY